LPVQIDKLANAQAAVTPRRVRVKSQSRNGSYPGISESDVFVDDVLRPMMNRLPPEVAHVELEHVASTERDVSAAPRYR
jgi:hypothetical protein